MGTLANEAAAAASALPFQAEILVSLQEYDAAYKYKYMMLQTVACGRDKLIRQFAGRMFHSSLAISAFNPCHDLMQSQCECGHQRCSLRCHPQGGSLAVASLLIIWHCQWNTFVCWRKLSQKKACTWVNTMLPWAHPPICIVFEDWQLAFAFRSDIKLPPLRPGIVSQGPLPKGSRLPGQFLSSFQLV